MDIIISNCDNADYSSFKTFVPVVLIQEILQQQLKLLSKGDAFWWPLEGRPGASPGRRRGKKKNFTKPDPLMFDNGWDCSRNLARYYFKHVTVCYRAVLFAKPGPLLWMSSDMWGEEVSWTVLMNRFIEAFKIDLYESVMSMSPEIINFRGEYPNAPRT